VKLSRSESEAAHGGLAFKDEVCMRRGLENMIEGVHVRYGPNQTITHRHGLKCSPDGVGGEVARIHWFEDHHFTSEMLKCFECLKDSADRNRTCTEAIRDGAQWTLANAVTIAFDDRNY
jgi:hypothetical protein